MAIELVVPKLGESITEAVIAKWLKNVGDAVAADEPVADLETDKVTVALPAPAAGVLTEQRFAVGATVKVGEVIAVMEKQTVKEQPSAVSRQPSASEQKAAEPSAAPPASAAPAASAAAA